MTRAHLLVRRLLLLQSAILVVGSISIGTSDEPGRLVRAAVPLTLAGIFLLIALALARASMRRLSFMLVCLSELLFMAGTLTIVRIDMLTAVALLIAVCVLGGCVVGTYDRAPDL